MSSFLTLVRRTNVDWKEIVNWFTILEGSANTVLAHFENFNFTSIRAILPLSCFESVVSKVFRVLSFLSFIPAGMIDGGLEID